MICMLYIHFNIIYTSIKLTTGCELGMVLSSALSESEKLRISGALITKELIEYNR